MRPGFPGGKDGPWDSDAVAAYLETVGSPKAPGRAEHRSESTADVVELTAVSKALVAQETARKLKLENDQTEGLLVPRDEVFQEIATMLLRVKERLEAIPDELLMELPAKTRHQLKGRMANKVRLILAEMSAWGDEVIK